MAAFSPQLVDAVAEGVDGSAELTSLFFGCVAYVALIYSAGVIVNRLLSFSVKDRTLYLRIEERKR